MQRDRERDGDALLRQPLNAGYNPRGRERHTAIAETNGIVLVQQTQCRDHVLVVFKRLARTHDDNRVNPCPILPQEVCNTDHLRCDLSHRQIALEPVQCRRAERTAHAAACLRGDAHAVPVRVAHQHRLRRLPVRELIEQLDRRTVSGVETGDDLRALDGELFRKPYTQRLCEVVHDIKRSRTALIHPSDDLICAEAGNVMLSECLGKPLLRPSKDIHSRLIRAIKKPSGPSVSGMICTMCSAVFRIGRNAPVSSSTKSVCVSKNALTTAAFSHSSIVQVL